MKPELIPRPIRPRERRLWLEATYIDPFDTADTFRAHGGRGGVNSAREGGLQRAGSRRRRRAAARGPERVRSSGCEGTMVLGKWPEERSERRPQEEKRRRGGGQEGGTVRGEKGKKGAGVCAPSTNKKPERAVLFVRAAGGGGRAT